MKFIVLVIATLVLAASEPIRCSSSSPQESTQKDVSLVIEATAEDKPTEALSAVVESSVFEPEKNVQEKTCTCNNQQDSDVQQSPEPISDVQANQDARVSPKKESLKTNKKGNSKKYKVITITLPENSESEADAGFESKVVEPQKADQAEALASEPKTEEPAEIDSELKEEANPEAKVVDEEEKEPTPIKKNSKSKAKEQNKKSNKYDNKRSKRDAKGGSKGQNKGKSWNKNKENKKSKGKNRK